MAKVLKKIERRYAFRKPNEKYTPKPKNEKINESEEQVIPPSHYGHTFHKYKESFFGICTLCKKFINPLNQSLLLICEACQMLIHNDCIKLINQYCVSHTRTKITKRHIFIKYNSFKPNFCMQCGHYISPFKLKGFKCSYCNKLVHETCITKVSPNCQSTFNPINDSLGKLCIKFINKFTIGEKCYIGFILVEAKDITPIRSDGLYDCFVKVICRSLISSKCIIYKTNVLKNTKNLKFNQLFEIDIDKDFVKGYILVELYLFKSQKKYKIIGCMRFETKEIINLTEPSIGWYILLPLADGKETNFQINKDYISELNSLVDRFAVTYTSGTNMNDTSTYIEKQPEAENTNDTPNYSSNDDKQTYKTKLLDFKLLKLIGKGGFSKVVLAQYVGGMKITGNFALKFLKKETYYKQENIDALKEESSILNLESTNKYVCKALGCFQNSDYIVFILEYYMGGDLLFYINKNGKLSDKVAQFYICELIDALIFLHKLKIVHRDVKAENIFIQKTGHIKLGDFSISKTLNENERTNTYCGTLEYIPPEYLLGLGYCLESDWWSVGILLHLLLTLEFPFNGDIDILFRAIMNDKPNIISNLNEQTKSIILEFLNKDEKERIGSGIKGNLELRTHVYFSEINWNLVKNQTIKPPFIPIYNDTSVENFESKLTQSVINLSPSIEKLPENLNDEFKDFDYFKL